MNSDDPMEESSEEESITFKDLGLDPRLERAVSKLGWNEPTVIQRSALPLALQGKDMLVHARTGTGKTACYALPVLQNVLIHAATASSAQVMAIVLIPTKELSRQVKVNFESLCRYCGDEVTVVELSAAAETVKEQKALLRDRPSIVIATPARIAARIADKSLDVKHCTSLVVDEADLVLGYGYSEDVSAVVRAMPTSRQTFLMSATLGKEVEKLRKEMLNRPAVLTLNEDDDEEEDGEQSKLQQLSLRTDRVSDRFLICYVMLKLRLIQGKTLIFVNSVNQGFKLHLFLQALFIPSAVLNSELPENSRNFVLEEFDQGKYNVLIASDESHLFQNEVLEAVPDATTGKRQKSLEQREYGVSRGFDFKNVANVLNFDFPATPEAYVHRIGRTARAGARGKALSFICSTQEEIILETAAELQKKDGTKIAPFGFKMQAVEGFRYRVEDVLSSITKNQVKEARAAQVKTEILRSTALKNHFEEHPRDLEAITASQNGSKRRKLPELKKIPDYLRPTAQDSVQIKRALGGNGGSIKDQKKRKSGWNKKKKRKGNDPLKSFKVKGYK